MKREEFEREYLKNLEDIVLPNTLNIQIEIVLCLKEKLDIQTFLVHNKYKNYYYILKIAYKNRGKVLKYEQNILKEIADAGIDKFPKPEFFLKEGAITYSMREYVEGETLLSLVKKRGCMPEKTLVNTAIYLCRLLEILHGQQPPIVHRDIKPENIVYTKKHTFTFIDFETARKYSPNKDYDTLVMGSRSTAAPEQYGFSQTDCRTDIYGLGMTLLYLACGSYDQKDLKESGLSRRLQKIIQKALAFDPDKRYANARQFRKELSRYKCKKKPVNLEIIKSKKEKEEKHEKKKPAGICDGCSACHHRRR